MRKEGLVTPSVFGGLRRFATASLRHLDLGVVLFISAKLTRAYFKSLWKTHLLKKKKSPLLYPHLQTMQVSFASF